MDRRGTRPRHAVLTVPTLGLPLWMGRQGRWPLPITRKHSAKAQREHTFDRWEASGVCVCYILMYCCQSDRALPAAAAARLFNLYIYILK